MAEKLHYDQDDDKLEQDLSCKHRIAFPCPSAFCTKKILYAEKRAARSGSTSRGNAGQGICNRFLLRPGCPCCPRLGEGRFGEGSTRCHDSLSEGVLFRWWQGGLFFQPQ